LFIQPHPTDVAAVDAVQRIKEIHMKALVMLLGAMLAAVVPLMAGDGPLSTTEWINVGVVAAGAAVVWIAANDEEGTWSYAKLFMSAIAAAGVVLISALADQSVSLNEWIQIGAVVLATVAVKQLGNVAPAQHRAA
jgi:hypothetical protein